VSCAIIARSRHTRPPALRIVEAVRWRLRATARAARYFPVRFQAWLAFRRNVSAYRVLDEPALRSTRKSDTVFIFGSGSSLNAISPEEWRAIEAHDTIGFNWFVRERFVRCDYHFVREVVDNDLDGSWKVEVPLHFDLVRDEPQWANTTFMIQTGFRATNGNRSIGYRHVPLRNPIFLWRTLDRLVPSPSIREGLSHSHGTLSECINFAALMGWRHIVLTGVDLYDRRYFWLGADEPLFRDATVNAQHRTANIVEGIGAWRDIFEPQGIHLYTYSPRSLLARVLPEWKWTTPGA
jgi:hypothetical protein